MMVKASSNLVSAQFLPHAFTNVGFPWKPIRLHVKVVSALLIILLLVESYMPFILIKECT